MENASKALLMAGSILIALLIIASAVYLIDKAKQPSDAYYKRVSAQEVEKYNTEITKNFTIINGENYVTAQGIVTLQNLLKTSKYAETTSITDLADKLGKTPQEILKKHSIVTIETKNYLIYYKVTTKINSDDGKIDFINIYTSSTYHLEDDGIKTN